MYLILFLHQTTTLFQFRLFVCGCILFCFYIKPQLDLVVVDFFVVVSYSVSTSNHNSLLSGSISFMLYLILFLHQTTTPQRRTSRTASLYLILFLHQTTTCRNSTPNSQLLYLILFLHQTTTIIIHNYISHRCILFCFYIKPQQVVINLVVYPSCILFCFYIKPQRTAIDRLKNSVLQLFLIFKNILTTVTKSI